MSNHTKIKHRKRGVNWSQIKAIFMRDIRLNIREFRFVLVFFFIQIIVPGAFYLGNIFQGRTCAYYSIILLMGGLSRNVITNYVLEREKKFRTTFKLMGKKTFSHFILNFIFKFNLVLKKSYQSIFFEFDLNIHSYF